MSHPLRADLTLFTYGTVSDGEFLRLSAHVDECVACGMAVALLGNVTVHDSRVHSIAERLMAEMDSSEPARPGMIADLQDVELALVRAGAGNRCHKWTVLLGRILFCEAWLACNQGDFRFARRQAAVAKRLFRASGDDFQLGRVLIAEARMFGQMRQTVRALAAACAAEEIFVRLGDDRRTRIARSCRAMAILNAKRFDEAVALYDELLSTAAADDADRHHWLNNLAWCFLERGETERPKALALQRGSSEPLLVSFSWRWILAECDARQGDLDHAIAQLVSLREDVRARDLRFPAMVIGSRLSEWLLKLGRAGEAMGIAREVIAYFVSQELPDRARESIEHLHAQVQTEPTAACEKLQIFRGQFPSLFNEPRFEWGVAGYLARAS
ncbi:MAG TPA: hypothetical protein VKB93_19720 [Thermoanaerobaculia bacterium]|nr:hypothetical protein [Thermoanaerobaculia bacterium]